MARRHLSDETVDGIVYGMNLANALARSPEAQQRKAEYQRKLRAAQQDASEKSCEMLIAELMFNNPRYLVHLLQASPLDLLRDRHAHTFWKQWA